MSSTGIVQKLWNYCNVRRAGYSMLSRSPVGRISAA